MRNKYIKEFILTSNKITVVFKFLNFKLTMIFHILSMQDWFDIQRFINIIHHINKLKKNTSELYQ